MNYEYKKRVSGETLFFCNIVFYIRFGLLLNKTSYKSAVVYNNLDKIDSTCQV